MGTFLPHAKVSSGSPPVLRHRLTRTFSSLKIKYLRLSCQIVRGLQFYLKLSVAVAVSGTIFCRTYPAKRSTSEYKKLIKNIDLSKKIPYLEKNFVFILPQIRRQWSRFPELFLILLAPILWWKMIQARVDLAFEFLQKFLIVYNSLFVCYN